MKGSNPQDHARAEEDWSHARRKVIYQEVACFFKHCSVDLLSFEDVRLGLHLDQKVDRGLQTIPVEQIRGSVGRHDDFTAAFLPRKKHMQERWEQVDMAMRAGKTPPIDAYQVGEAYFVVDGNHRVSIARERGLETIQAYVSEFITSVGLSAEADIDEILIKSEQVDFLERIGPNSPPAVREIEFTCPDCYSDLFNMIEIYRQGREESVGKPVSIEQAVPGWYEKVYGPAVEMIVEHELLARFTDRSPADLFIWAWKNHKALEDLFAD